MNTGHCHRILLEAFKFLEPRDLLQVDCVCSEWKLCSREDEVWAVHLLFSPEDDSIPARSACREQLRRPHFLAFVNGTSLTLTDFMKQSVRRIELRAPFRATSFGAWVSLPNSVLYCGGVGNGYVADSFLIDVNSAAVKKLPNMHTHRAGAGLIYRSGKVYVFGGDNENQRGRAYGDLENCEKYTVATNTWTVLPSMSSPRRSFTPVEWNDKVIIAGGGGANAAVEVFDLKTETFLPNLELTLPFTDSLACAFVQTNSLVVLANDGLHRFDLAMFRHRESRTIPHRYWYSPGAYITFKDVTYFGVYYEDTVYQLNSTFAITEVRFTR